MELEPQKHGPERQPERAPQRLKRALDPQPEPLRREPEPVKRGLDPQPLKREPKKQAKAPGPARPPMTPKGATIPAILLAVLVLATALMWIGRDLKRDSPHRAANESETKEIVVDLVDNATEDQIKKLGDSLGIEFRLNSPESAESKLMVASISPGTSAAILNALRKSPLVEAADLNTPVEGYAKSMTPNDPDYPKQWHLRMVGVEDAWRVTRGRGAVVAVVDSGVGLAGPSGLQKLQDFDKTRFAQGYDFVEHDDVPQDAFCHGTHVAGTIAESTDNGILGAGIAPEATIMPVRVLDAQNRGSSANIADGIRWAAKHGANVINLSLGSPSYNAVVALACQDAVKRGTTLVCAAGNDGKEEIGYPAKLKECIAVSAVGPNQQIAPYSNYGDQIDITAPGGDQTAGKGAGIWQNTIGIQGRGPDGFYSLQGTSMATPHVTGVIALLVSVGVKAPAEIRSLLRKSAHPMGEPKLYGAGLLNAPAALKMSGRNPASKYLGYAALCAAALLIYLMVAREHAVSAMIALGAGFFVPLVIEKMFGFGSPMNFVGHSVAIALIWLMTPNLTRTSLLYASCFSAGLAVHFVSDVYAGSSPFQVQYQSRIALWFYLNLAIAAYIIVSNVLKTTTVAPRSASVGA